MSRLFIISILLLLSFITLTSVSAKNLNIDEISANLEAIQVGAFKEIKNISLQNQLFSHYNTFIEYGEELNRFYIVNVKKVDYARILAEVKISHPGAFSASDKLRKLIKNHTHIARWKGFRKVKRQRDPVNYSLNSETILKTRKKFF